MATAMIAKRSAGESVAQKVFVRSTKAGGAIKVFREQYLRDDIPCGSKLCHDCAAKVTPDFKGNVVQPVLSDKPLETHRGTPFYVVVDTNVCLKAIDLLEHPDAFHDVIIPHVVLEEVRNRSLPIYSRLRSLTSSSGDSDKRFYVFHNEFSEDTYTARKKEETVNDYNDRAIRKVAKYYNKHLPKVETILVSNDRLNREAAREKKIPTLSLREYADVIGSKELLDSVPVSEDSEDASNSKSHENVYETHLPTSRILGGLQNGTLHQGKLSISRYNYLEASVSVQGFTKPLLVIGREAMNRSFDGDKVVVELLPKRLWRRPLAEMAEENAGDQDGNEDEEAEAIISEAERKLLANDAKLAQQQAKSEENPSEYLQPTGRVVGILKRNWRFYVGSLVSDATVKPGTRDTGALRSVLFRPMDNRIPRIRIKTRRPIELSGQRIVVAVDDWPVWSRSPEGHFVRLLGEIEDHKAETESILLEHDIEYRPFPQAAMNCLPPEGDNWQPEENAPNRRDLRHLNICSIDPPKCQDIDDALHAHVLPNGNLSLGVHIADVTHFVKADTPLDREGSIRATSTYLVDRRIDMLPSLLGTNLCSLRPYVERYAFSVLWEMTPEGDIVSTDFTKSLIKSRQAFEYSEAQAKIDDESQQDELAKSMRILLRISKILKQRRMDAGALNLASPEVKILTGDEMNEPTSVEIKKPVATNSLVEEFMLLANITVARKIQQFAPQTALLRRHAAPPASNFDVLNDQLRLKGYNTIKLDSSKTVADSLDNILDDKDPFFNTLVRIMATRSMMAAEYFPAGDYAYPEFRHYGLATDIYTHFTSPIRRYADIIVHRQLAASIDYERLPPSHFRKDNLEGIVDNINTRHRNAQFAGRASVEYFVGQMLKKQQTKDTLQGYIVKVFSNGVGILVPRYGLESVIRLEDICANPDRDAQLDEDNYVLHVKQETGKEISLSIFEKVNVVVESIKNEGTGKRSVRMTLE